MNGIEQAASERFDTLTVVPGQRIHQHCRNTYIRPSSIVKHLSSTHDNVVAENVTPKLRSTEQQFNSAEHCLFCGQTAKMCGLKRGSDCFHVCTVDCQNSIRAKCTERNDE